MSNSNSNWYQILAGFLERYGHEVEGRSQEPLPPEVREKLRLFAVGTLAQAEQQRLTELLRQHPNWVGVLAGEIKALRPPLPPKAALDS